MNELKVHGIDTEKYSVFHVLDQTSMILHVAVQSNEDPAKAVQKQKVMTADNIWNGYLSAVVNMAKECIKELENG